MLFYNFFVLLPYTYSIWAIKLHWLDNVLLYTCIRSLTEII